jgi:predicted transcriptional regulator
MSDLLTPADIERLARKLGITMAEVCRRAGIATSIFTRWKSGLTSPSYRNYQRIIDAVHAGKPAPVAETEAPPKPKSKRRTPANTTSSSAVNKAA